MENFEFMSPTKFLLEEDADLLCGREAKRYSDKVLFVHYGDQFTYESGLHGRITKALEEAGVACFELSGVKPNPDVELVREGVKICRQEGIGCVLAAGGGSVIDTAKAVALGAMYDGDVWDFYTKKAVPEKALPIGAVMTLPATGSEGSNGSVLNNRQTGENLDVMAEFLRPSFTLMNPALTLGIPKRQTVFGIIDMFSHVMERYFCNSRDVELTDRMCEAVMKAIIVNAGKLMENLQDYNTRAEFMWTAVVAHNGLLATGRQQDWATHAIGAQLSARYNTVHGAALSVLFPCWAEYVMKENVARFAQFANRVFDVDMDFYDQERTAREGIRRMREFFTSMGAPASLAEIGVTSDEEFAGMAENVCRFGNVGGLKSLDKTDVEKIYRMAL